MSVRKRHVWRLLAVAGAGFGIYVWRQRELIRLIRQGLRLYPDKRPEFAAIMQRLVWAVTEGSVFARSYPLAHRDIRYGAHSRQRLDLFQPPGAAGCPLLFFVHGGGWESGRKELYSSVAREFTSLGYVVVIINYRLAPQVSFPVFVADAAAALRWTVDNVTAYGGDRGAIVLAGHSAGAHIVSLLGLDERFLGEQGVDLGVIRGVVGMQRAIRSACVVGACRQSGGLETRGGSPDRYHGVARAARGSVTAAIRPPRCAAILAAPRAGGQAGAGSTSGGYGGRAARGPRSRSTARPGADEPFFHRAQPLWSSARVAYLSGARDRSVCPV